MALIIECLFFGNLARFMDKNLLVPYLSQWDTTASKTRNDCGPSSLAMALNFYGENLTVDQVFEKTGAGTGYISLPQLAKAASYYGYKCEAFTNGTAEALRGFINQGIPVITVVHYGLLSSRQDTNFSGPHIFLTVGYRDDGYFVNDPDFWGSFRKDGDHHFYTKADFENAWEQSALDGNVRNTYMVVYPKKVEVSDTDMVIQKDLFVQLRTKASNYDVIAEAYGQLFADRTDPEAGKKLLEYIKARQSVLATDGTVTYTQTPPVTNNVTYPLPNPSEADKSILFQDVSTLFEKIKKLLGGNK